MSKRDTQGDDKVIVVSIERQHRPAMCPKVPLVRTPVWAGPNTRLALYFTISTFFDAVFGSSQLASFNLVPVMPRDARGEPLYTLY